MIHPTDLPIPHLLPVLFSRTKGSGTHLRFRKSLSHPFPRKKHCPLFSIRLSLKTEILLVYESYPEPPSPLRFEAPSILVVWQFFGSWTGTNFIPLPINMNNFFFTHSLNNFIGVKNSPRSTSIEKTSTEWWIEWNCRLCICFQAQQGLTHDGQAPIAHPAGSVPKNVHHINIVSYHCCRSQLVISIGKLYKMNPFTKQNIL